jgi:hypothetical protein
MSISFKETDSNSIDIQIDLGMKNDLKMQDSFNICITCVYALNLLSC